MSGLNLQKLEALLARVRRNRTAAPVRVHAAAAAPQPVAAPPAPLPTSTPKPPPVAASAPPLRMEPPVASSPPPRVEPPPYVEPFVRAEEAPRVEPPRVEPPRIEPPPYLEPPARTEPSPIEAPASVASPEPPAVATPSWRPEPGSAVQARPTSVPPMEISDDDLLEVSTLPPDAAPAGAESPQLEVGAIDVEVTATDAEEAEEAEEGLPPASSRRFKVPESLDDGAVQGDSEREIPVKTPPPESGPQEALPATGLEAPRMPDVAELEADLSGPPSMGPTAEQLGETIELEAPRGPELEIDVTVVADEEETSVPAPAEELEVSLPSSSLQSGLYDVGVGSRPAASVEAPAAEAPKLAATAPHAAEEAGPERTSRPALGATDVAAVALATPSSARTFVELLDASLGL